MYETEDVFLTGQDNVSIRSRSDSTYLIHPTGLHTHRKATQATMKPHPPVAMVEESLESLRAERSSTQAA